MLTEIIIACDGKNPEPLSSFDDVFNYKGKKKLKKLKSLQAKADTSDMSLAYLGDTFPGLQKLRLNNSIIHSIRDLRSNLPNLIILSLARCGITCLDGISTISDRLQELYLAFNQVDDLSELIGMNSLRILDLESNSIPYVENCELLKCCINLRNLTLRGNGCVEHPEYRSEIKRLIPKLIYLDEIRFGEENKKEEVDTIEKVLDEKVKLSTIETENKKEDENRGEAGVPTKLRTAEEPYRDKTVLTDMVIDQVMVLRPPTTALRGNAMLGGSKPRVIRPKVKAWHNIGSIRL